MKNKTAILFILLANIVMLVHHFMPHHQPLSETSDQCQLVCQIEIEEKACPTTHTQQLNGKNAEQYPLHIFDIEDCTLEEIHLRFSNKQNQVADYDYNQLPLLIYLRHVIIELIEPIETTITQLAQPYIYPKYNTNFVRIYGMRAPPFC